MRTQHELPAGVICEKCGKTTTKYECYKRINALQPIMADCTGRFDTIHRMNLCPICYKQYEGMVAMWLKKEVEE